MKILKWILYLVFILISFEIFESLLKEGNAWYLEVFIQFLIAAGLAYFIFKDRKNKKEID